MLATVVAGAAGAVFLTVRGWLQPEGPEPSWPALLVLGAAAGGLILIARRGEPQSHSPAALILAAIVLSRILYTLAVDQPRFSDFGVMWDYAASIARGPYRYPGNGSAAYQALIESRALPYLAPVALLSGGHPIGYQLANAVVIGVCALLTYLLTCVVANRKAGLIALWLIAVAPEPLLAAEIPTHDIPGTLLAMLALGLVFLGHRWSRDDQRGGGAFLALGVLLGVVVWLADLQRGTGLFLLIAIAGAAALLWAGGGARRWGWVLAATVVVPVLMISVLKRSALPLVAGPVATQEGAVAKWSWIAIYGNSESTGYWDLEGLLPLLQTLDHEQLRTFALARAASDLVDAGTTRVRNYAKRIATVNRLGSQYHWYLDDKVDGRRWVPTAVLDQASGERFSGFLRSYSEGFRLVFLLLTVFSVTAIVFLGRPEPLSYLPLLVLGVLTLSFGLLGEAQPRYLFAAWFLLPIAIGWFLTQRVYRKWQLATLRDRALELAIAGTITLLVLLGMIAVIRSRLGSDWPRLIQTAQLGYEGGAVSQGRYRTLLTEDSAAVATVRLPARGRVTVYAARDLRAKLPCSRQLRLTVDDRISGETRIDTAAKASVLGADLTGAPTTTARVAVHGVPQPERGCSVLIWLLQVGD